MQRIRRLRHQRGALEGLPLYLIILIVVAAIVVAILVGWLSTLQHPGIGSATFVVDPALSGVAVSEGVVPYSSSADTGSFTANPDGSCSFFVTPGAPAGGGAAEALIVTVDDKSGSPLVGATVQVTATGISVTPSPSASATTDSSGQASWSSITGTIPPGDNTGGYINLAVSYSSGGITTTANPQIAVEPPAGISC